MTAAAGVEPALVKTTFSEPEAMKRIVSPVAVEVATPPVAKRSKPV